MVNQLNNRHQSAASQLDSQHLFLEPSQFTQPGYRHLMLSGFEYRPEFQIPLTQWRNHFDAVFLINQVSPSP